MIAFAIESYFLVYFQLTEEVILRIFDQHPNWTPTKGRLSDQARPKRCLSMASALDVIGDAFRNGTMEKSLSSPNSPDTLTSGFHSRLPSQFSDRKSSTEDVNVIETRKNSYNDCLSSALESKDFTAFLVDRADGEYMDPDKQQLIDFAQEAKTVLRKQRMHMQVSILSFNLSARYIIEFNL